MFQGISIVRRIPGASSVFLTFDDGPDANSTPAVLDLLDEFQANATFFVIAEKARAQPQLLRRMLASGHRVGNHSLDHRYGQYFRGKKRISAWVSDSEKCIADLSGQPTVGFRPPAGVWTPELRWVLNDLQLPMVMWSTRYFDTRFALTPARIDRSWAKVGGGSIVLLHDRKSSDELPAYLASLRYYLERLQGEQKEVQPLSLEQCRIAAGMRRADLLSVDS